MDERFIIHDTFLCRRPIVGGQSYSFQRFEGHCQPPWCHRSFSIVPQCPSCYTDSFSALQILLYEVKSSGKFRKRTMPIRDLGKSSDCYALAERLKRRHDKFLADVVTVRIEKLLRILQITMAGESLKGALSKVQVGLFWTRFHIDLKSQIQTEKISK